MATKFTSKGNALYVVFAPANKISIVASWTMMNMIEPNVPVPTAAFAICEITVGTPDSYGIAWM